MQENAGDWVCGIGSTCAKVYRFLSSIGNTEVSMFLWSVFLFSLPQVAMLRYTNSLAASCCPRQERTVNAMRPVLLLLPAL